MEKVAVQTEIGTMNLAMTPELKAALLSLEVILDGKRTRRCLGLKAISC